MGEPAEDDAEDVEEGGVVFGATKQIGPLVEEEGAFVGCVEERVHGDECTTEAEREGFLGGRDGSSASSFSFSPSSPFAGDLCLLLPLLLLRVVEGGEGGGGGRLSNACTRHPAWPWRRAPEY